MRRKIIFFCLFAWTLLCAHHFGSKSPLSYFVLAGLVCLFPFYFLFDEDKVSFVFSSGLILASLVWKASTAHDAESLYFLASFLILVGTCFYHHMQGKHGLALSAEKKARSTEEVLALKRKYDDKENSLTLMTRQLGEMTHLYELAKALNDCLSYQKLVEDLRKEIFEGLVFKESILLVFQGETDPPSVVRRFTIHESGSVEDSQTKTDLTNLEKKIILAVHDRKEMLVIKSSDEMDSSWLLEESLHFPVAIFPLVVQDKAIAVFLVDGWQEEDLPKFQVVAAQLALHVKKIKLYDTVHELSIIDGLTNVFVRRHFLERFEEELKRSIRHGFKLAVLMLDIDHFKSYNDNHGHLVGDVTLRDVAQVILNGVRRVDIVARYGGEEFAVVLPETDKKEGLEVAERIRSAVAKRQFRAYDEETRVTLSIGVATFPGDLEEQVVKSYRSDFILELLKKADQALYQAKEEGRNRVVAFGTKN